MPRLRLDPWAGPFISGASGSLFRFNRQLLMRSWQNSLWNWVWPLRWSLIGEPLCRLASFRQSSGQLRRLALFTCVFGPRETNATRLRLEAELLPL